MLRNYVKLALKVLARRKFFTFVSLFAISFTLLVLLVATAFLDHAFSGSSPESKIGRTIGIYRVAMFGPNNVQMGAAGYRVYDQFIRRADGLEATAIAETQHKVPSFLGGRKVESWMKHTDAGYWRIFDFQFVEGGPFTAVDDAQAAHVAVINEATRQRFFGGAPAVGKTIEADGQRFRVVGVVRNVSFLRFLSFSDIWVPLSTERSSSYRQELMGRFYALGLLRDASDRGRVQAEIRAATGRAQLPDPKNYDRLVAPADDRFNGIARILLPGASMGDRQDADRASI